MHLNVLTDQSLRDSSLDWAAADMDLGTKSPLLCGPDKGMLLVAEITPITISHISKRERESRPASQPERESESK